MSKDNTEALNVSQGVDELIHRLHQDGVDAGKAEADKLVEEAKAKAKTIVTEAEAQAKSQLQDAKKKSQALLSGGEEALKTAMRDMVLSLKSDLTNGFKEDVERLIAHELQSPELLKTLIIELVGKLKSASNINDKSEVEVLLPSTIPDIKALESEANSPLTALVFGITREMLIDGVTFSSSSEVSGGMLVKLTGEDLVLDFSEQAVASMLLAHLQPRFRAMLEGVMR
jgi:V/A-type H+-transporting ATPase subunit E